MKTLSFYLLVFSLILSVKIGAQNINTWRISVGYSIFTKSDDLLIDNRYSNFNNFNFPNTLSIENRIHNNFSFKFSGTVNEFEKISTAQNLSINKKNDLFLGLDLALKYSLMGEKGKSTWFNPFLTAGFGYSKFDIFGDTKLTAGVGSNFWIKKNFGLQIGSTFNKSVAIENSNYLNHFVGFIVLFNKNVKTDLVEKNKVDNEIVDNSKNEIKEKGNKQSEKDKDALKDVKKIESKITTLSSENKDVEKDVSVIDIKTSPEKDVNSIKAKEFSNPITKKEIVENDILSENENKTIANTKVITNIETKNELKTEKVLDSDGDKVPDELDKCPTVFGEALNAGCPKKNDIDSNSSNSNIKKENVNENSKVENNESVLKITSVYFDIDDATVLDNERSKIHMIIYIMDKNPNSKIIIEGHTAKDGDIDYNKKLSENRAKAVKQYFITKGISANKIEIKSLGSSQPVSNETTEKAKALNRRARIILTK